MAQIFNLQTLRCRYCGCSQGALDLDPWLDRVRCYVCLRIESAEECLSRHEREVKP